MLVKKIYYKIGEFSKLTGVNIKSLRYYDSIGVLKPAYIDPQTNYRFYIPEQIIQLDIIKLCLSFNIPLKNMKRSDDGQTPNLKWIISQGKEKANEQLIQAQRMLNLSDDLLNQVERLDQNRKKETPYTCIFEKRQVLITPWYYGVDTDKTYLKKIAMLHKIADEKGYTVLTQQGILKDCLKNQFFVYISIYEDCIREDKDIIQFQKGNYTCMVLDESKFSDLSEILKVNNINSRYIFCLNTDIYDFCLEHNLHMLEVQCLIN